MKKQFYLLLCILFSCTVPLHGAESQDQKSVIETLGLTVREGFASKTCIDNPAVFGIVWPGSGKSSSYSLDIGLSTMDPLVGNLSPTVEYHRHSEISRPQDNFQIGLLDIYALNGVNIQWALKYKNDKIVTGDGVLGKMDIVPFYKPLAMGSGRITDLGTFLWQPSFGIQYEHASDLNSSSRSGNVTRGFLNINLAIYPLDTITSYNKPDSKGKKNHDKRLEITLSNLYWYNVSRSGGFADYYSRTQNLFKAGVNCYFDREGHFGIGYDYLIGENPEQGFLQQHSSQIAFRLKY